jgi:hypothetical protein
VRGYQAGLVQRVEDAQPAVVAARLADLAVEVWWVRRWIVGLTVSILASAAPGLGLVLLRGRP